MKKRFISLIICLVMLLGLMNFGINSFAAGSVNLTKGTGYDITATWDPVAGASSYLVRLMQYKPELTVFVQTGIANPVSADKTLKWTFTSVAFSVSDIPGINRYYIDVEARNAIGETITTLKSKEFTVDIPTLEAPIPVLSASGLLSFDAVDSATDYKIELYGRSGSSGEGTFISKTAVRGTECDMSADMSAGYEYRCSVFAVNSDNLRKNSAEAWTDWVEYDDTVTLGDLSFAVTAPKIGSHPKYSVIADKSYYYDIQVKWEYNYQSYNFKEMSKEDVFESGIRYRVLIKLVPKNGHNIIREKTQKTLINDREAGWNFSTKEFSAVFYADDTYYDIYVGHTRVGKSNKNDVLGDGSVRYYPKGEYKGVNTVDGSEYGKYASVLVLDNLKMTESDFTTFGDNSAQIYIAEDTYIVLKGSNTLYDKCTEAHGIYLASGKIVTVYGDGSLNIDASYRDYDAIRGYDSSIYFRENVKVELTGAHAYYCSESTGTDFGVYDNVKATCTAIQTDDSHDYPAVVSPYIYVSGNAELICMAQYCGEIFDTWGCDEYSNTDYEIKILKTHEFQNTGKEPYTPTSGVNIDGGVHESDCRYIYITPKNKSTAKLGDVNGDGEIKLADAMMAFKYVAKTGTLKTDEFTRADCNKDGYVKLADAMAIFKYVAKVTNSVEF